jgi:thymidine kinase
MAEPTPPYPNTGWIEVIVGSMYSGKTEELIRRLRRAQIARQRVEIFKPAMDDRFARDAIVSHSELSIPSRSVRTAREILRYAHEAQVIGIDEGQFLGPELVKVCERLARKGKRVIVAGLDQDYAGRPFDPMPQLLAIAEYITKTLAICVVCGNPANRSYRKKRRTGRVVVGGADLYEARCRRCYELGRRVQPPEEEAEPPVSAGRGGTHREPATGATPVHAQPASPKGGKHVAAEDGPHRRGRGRRRRAARRVRPQG